ncbi:HEAT repeat domain-containing protein [Thiocapsa imhoffii]|uniref:HEAT repeat domain-containing protein n=1 Tax=Thiocapsa imhoffii TaxID=382777 RepID=UPI001906301E|nr:HEAT repeat domain-containing protein [Thiocapsa imhoffii]
MTLERKQNLRNLLDLGKPEWPQVEWPEYSQYGIGSADVDDLIQLAVDPLLHGAPQESNAVWVPLHAWRALGQIGDSRAIDPLIHLLDTLYDDEYASMEIPAALGMIGEHAIGPLVDFLEDASRSEFVRMLAADALGQLAGHHPSAKNQVIARLTEYLDDPDPSATGLNGNVVIVLLDLEARSSIDTLRRLYRSGNVDLFACGDIEDVEIELGLRTQRITPRPDLTQLYDFPQPTLRKPDKKVGRNDPCPCGSGKKYKKCCLP